MRLGEPGGGQPVRAGLGGGHLGRPREYAPVPSVMWDPQHPPGLSCKHEDPQDSCQKLI